MNFYLSSHIEMLHSVGSNVYTCLHRTVNNPQLPLLCIY